MPYWDNGKGYDEWLYMPKWRKVAISLFAVSLPILGSIVSINF